MGPIRFFLATIYGFTVILLLKKSIILSEPLSNFDCHYFNNTECDQEKKNANSGINYINSPRCQERSQTCSLQLANTRTNELGSRLWPQLDGKKIIDSSHSPFLDPAHATDGSTLNITQLQPTCFVVWSNETTPNNGYTLKVMNKGCWAESKDCNEKDCVDERPPSRSIRFCCCRGHLCNAKFRLEPLISSPITNTTTVEPQFVWIISGSVTSLVIVTLFLSICFYYRRKRFRSLNGSQYEMPNHDDTVRVPLQLNATNDKNGVIDLNKVELICQLASGRYGNVHRGRAQLLATNEDIEVAVKISSPQEFQSLQNEQQVYCLPQMKHNNILKFYCSEKKIDNDGLNFSLWLLTEYMELGSLHDYLKSHTITWTELLFIAQGIACGMQHLHEDIIATNDQARKPAVAHRDFKSKNVLLKPNLTPCVADFGLAYIFYPDQPVSTKHGQIGTRRYMAPEILGGSIGFTADAFIKIDMYAVSLVMWELISRCVISDSIRPTEPYMLPFEREAGPMPTTETMQKIVCLEHKRPILKEEWRYNPETELFCKSIEESWDNDPEARSSAANIYERVKKMLSKYPNKDECEGIGDDLE